MGFSGCVVITALVVHDVDDFSRISVYNTISQRVIPFRGVITF